MFASILLVFACFLYLIFLWYTLLKSMGENVSFLYSFVVWFFSMLGRYIPGKVWQFAGMVWLLKKEGVPIHKGGASTILQYFLNVAAGALIASYTFSRYNVKHSLLFIPLVLIIFFAIYPPITQKILNFGLKMVKRPPIELKVSFGTILLLLLANLFGWAIYGLAFFIYLNAFTSISWVNFLSTTSSFAGAYLIGLLVFLTPAGLGVREASLTYFLDGIIPLPINTAVALLQRVWMTIPELIGIGISIIILRRRKSEETIKIFK